MFPSLPSLRHQIEAVLRDKTAQGHETEGLKEALAALPDNTQNLIDFAERIMNLPLRPDWPWREPNEWDEIETEMHHARPRGPIRTLDEADHRARIEAAFLGSVVGCILGKPVEVMPTLAELKTALTEIGDWPLNDYFSQRLNLRNKQVWHGSHNTCLRENIAFAESDDDINYTVMGMLILERHGLNFTREHLRHLWMGNIAPATAWGPERTFVIRMLMPEPNGGEWHWDDARFFQSVHFLNPGDELCGATIRADAYGYAAAGNPELAAQLAWRDASTTHRRTGIYATMFVAAAIAAMPVVDDPVEAFEIALQFVPQQSRFHSIVEDCLQIVRAASDWETAYDGINAKYHEYGHCMNYMECGTLINSLRFAESVGHGVCLQVMQGMDTDSFGATAGSLLGMRFGPGHLEDRWLAPFQNRIHVGMASFHEQDLTRLAQRMGNLCMLTREPDAANPAP